MTKKSCLMPAILLLIGLLGATHAQTRPVTAQVVCHGDSLTWGANVSASLRKPGVLREQATGTATAGDPVGVKT